MIYTFTIKVDIKAEHMLMLGYAFKDVCNYIDNKSHFLNFLSGQIESEEGKNIDFTEDGLTELKKQYCNMK